MQKTSSFLPNFPSSPNDATILYNFVGNFIPPEWSGLLTSRGKALSGTAKRLLSLIVCLSKNHDYSNGELQESYYFFESALGVCGRRVNQCLRELEDGGFIQKRLINGVMHGVRCRNILCIKLAKNFQHHADYIRSCSDYYSNANSNVLQEVEVQTEKEARKLASINNCQSDSLHVELQDFSPLPEKNFRLDGNFFHPLNIIDNNISILESRYKKSNFEKILNLSPYTTSDTNCHTSDKLSQPLSTANTDTGWLQKVTSKARELYRGKKLEEFHPLNEEDAEQLRLRSHREFGLSFINKLLMNLSKKYPDHKFYSKNAVLTYMTKALANEMRQATVVNNEGFRFKSDCSNSEARHIEKYLATIEYATSTSNLARFRRKLAAAFEPAVAYEILNSCWFSDEVVGTYYRIKLSKNIRISEHAKAIILREVRAVYGNVVTDLEVVPTKDDSCSSDMVTGSFAGRVASNVIDNHVADGHTTTDLVGMNGLDQNSVWSKMRVHLRDCYGEAIDRSWFSKLDLVKEDETSKTIVLKPSTAFIGSWIKNHYFSAFGDALKALGQDYSCELIEA